MATPKAPPGGFKEGGWYDGKQYIGGSFSQPGQIHSSSSQQGAGQMVSKEVVQQTDPKNWDYLQSQQPQRQEPKSAEEVTPFLNQYQQDLLKTSQTPETRVPTTGDLKTELLPETKLPELLDRTGMFEDLRTTHGVADLEKQMTSLKSQEDELEASFREQKFTEEGKPVAMNVIAGRIGEEERQYLERKDYLGRQMSRVADELNTKYALVNQLMTFSGLDYNDAVERYQTEFSNNIQVYNLVADARKEARSEYEYDRDAAKANLQVFMNAITSGNLSYGDLDMSEKVMVGKLEAQSGLPTGFISNLKMSPGDRMVSVNDETGEALMLNANGSFEVIQTGMRISPKSSTTTDTKANREQFDKAAESSNFPDLVNQFANTMSLEEIYKAYANSEMGKEYGTPTENPQEVKLLYKIARGEMTPEEARAELGGY